MRSAPPGTVSCFSWSAGTNSDAPWNARADRLANVTSTATTLPRPYDRPRPDTSVLQREIRPFKGGLAALDAHARPQQGDIQTDEGRHAVPERPAIDPGSDGTTLVVGCIVRHRLTDQ